jgi:hypothetical protein
MSTGCGCSNEPGGKNQDAGVDADSSQQDGRVDADAARDGAADGEVDSAVFDAGPVDAFVYHDCMAPMEVQEITPGELYRIPVVEQDFHGGIAWNGQFAWTEQRSSYWAVYARGLVTQVEEIVTEGDADKILRGASGDFVTWFDYTRSGCEFPCSTYDIYARDLGNGAERRLNYQPGYWAIGSLTCQWLLYFESEGSGTLRAYVFDAFHAGVLDQSCNLIPCDPQTEQCAMLEWQGP